LSHAGLRVRVTCQGLGIGFGRERTSASTTDAVTPTAPHLGGRQRRREHVQRCLEALRAAGEKSLPMDLAAEELRIASSELGQITGAVGVEELLDVIFRDFCIGK
ncbi:unnamed protein product, partial [Discosporangium mesarthrocarpum]